MIKRLLRRVLQQPLNSFRGVFGSFEEAVLHVPPWRKVGYDIPETAEWYRDLLDGVQHDDYPMLFWFEKALVGSYNVVEIGGHVGVAYYSFTKLLECPSLQWTIIDVPSVTMAGARLATQRGRDNLHFVNYLSQAAIGCDVLLASGSLQYLDAPLLPERIRDMSPWPRHIIINKTPVRDNGDGYVTLQDLGVSMCPYRIHGRRELIAALEQMDYHIVATWRKDRRVQIKGRADLAVEYYSGYYLQRAL